MARPSNTARRADRLEAQHARATGELAGWVCLEPTGCEQLGEEQLTRGDAGAEWFRHYLERHYRPPATRARSLL